MIGNEVRMFFRRLPWQDSHNETTPLIPLRDTCISGNATIGLPNAHRVGNEESGIKERRLMRKEENTLVLGAKSFHRTSVIRVDVRIP